jgi:mannose-6-phosphate isomerase
VPRAEDLRAPLALPPNRIRVFYQGGALIDRLRGVPNPADDDRPEDWVGSATALGWRGRDPADGVSAVVVSGRRILLTDLLDRYPEEMLGPRHLAAFGATPALLVKLLDAAVRLPVHSHPTTPFARAHLGAPNGKTEAWIVIDTRSGTGAAPYVLLGFARVMSRAELLDCIARQDAARMMGAMHRLHVRAGDVIFVPAGLPHAIGPGIFIVELQEPSSLSVLMEHVEFGVAPSAAHLGLGWERIIDDVDRTAHAPADLVARFTGHVAADARGAVDLFGPAAAPYFRASRVRLEPGGFTMLPAGFTVVIVLGGAGEIRRADALTGVRVARGDQILLPFCLGEVIVTAGEGGVDMLCCRPPAAASRASVSTRA